MVRFAVIGFAVFGLSIACGSSRRDHFGDNAAGTADPGGSGGLAAGGRGGAAGRGGAGGTGGMSSGGTGGDFVEPPTDGGMTDADPECQREVSLQAVTLGEPAPFDLIIVADHSGSLS